MIPQSLQLKDGRSQIETLVGVAHNPGSAVTTLTPTTPTAQTLFVDGILLILNFLSFSDAIAGLHSCHYWYACGLKEKSRSLTVNMLKLSKNQHAHSMFCTSAFRYHIGTINFLSISDVHLLQHLTHVHTCSLSNAYQSITVKRHSSLGSSSVMTTTPQPICVLPDSLTSLRVIKRKYMPTLSDQDLYQRLVTLLPTGRHLSSLELTIGDHDSIDLSALKDMSLLTSLILYCPTPMNYLPHLCQLRSLTHLCLGEVVVGRLQSGDIDLLMVLRSLEQLDLLQLNNPRSIQLSCSLQFLPRRVEINALLVKSFSVLTEYLILGTRLEELELSFLDCLDGQIESLDTNELIQWSHRIPHLRRLCILSLNDNWMGFEYDIQTKDVMQQELVQPMTPQTDESIAPAPIIPMMESKEVQPRLVGFETNPGPVVTTNTSPSPTAQTLFADGILSIFNFLSLRDVISAYQSCYYWFECGLREKSREIDLDLSKLPGSARKPWDHLGSEDLSIFKSPISYHITSLSNVSIRQVFLMHGTAQLGHIKQLSVHFTPNNSTLESYESNHPSYSMVTLPSTFNSLTSLHITVHSNCMAASLIQSFINSIAKSGAPITQFKFRNDFRAHFFFSMLRIPTLTDLELISPIGLVTCEDQSLFANLPLRRLIFRCQGLGSLDLTVYHPQSLIMMNIEGLEWSEWNPTDSDWDHLTPYPPPHLHTLTLQCRQLLAFRRLSVLQPTLTSIIIRQPSPFITFELDDMCIKSFCQCQSLQQLTCDPLVLNDPQLCQLLTSIKLNQLELAGSSYRQFLQAWDHLPPQTIFHTFKWCDLRTLLSRISHANRCSTITIHGLFSRKKDFPIDTFPTTPDHFRHALRQLCEEHIRTLTQPFQLKIKCAGSTPINFTYHHSGQPSEPPQPPLIGIEPNPGPFSMVPVTPNSTSSSHRNHATSHVQTPSAQTLFVDGLLSIYQFLTLSDVVLGMHSCHHWYACGLKEKCRQLEFRLFEMDSSDRQFRRLLILNQSPLNYHITCIRPMSMCHVLAVKHLDLPNLHTCYFYLSEPLPKLLDTFREWNEMTPINPHEFPSTFKLPPLLKTLRLSISTGCPQTIYLCDQLINCLSDSSVHTFIFDSGMKDQYYDFSSIGRAHQLTSLHLYIFTPLSSHDQRLLASLPLTEFLIGERSPGPDWSIFHSDTPLMRTVREWYWSDTSYETRVNHWVHLSQHPPPNITKLDAILGGDSDMIDLSVFPQLTYLNLDAYDPDEIDPVTPKLYTVMVSRCISLTTLILGDDIFTDEQVCGILIALRDSLRSFQLITIDKRNPLIQTFGHLPPTTTVHMISLQPFETFLTALSQSTRAQKLSTVSLILDPNDVNSPKDAAQMKLACQRYCRNRMRVDFMLEIGVVWYGDVKLFEDFVYQNSYTQTLEMDETRNDNDRSIEVVPAVTIASNDHPPTPPLVGIERNPGPSITTASGRTTAQTLFVDGILSIFSWLSLSELLPALHSCHYWCSCGLKERSRLVQFNYDLDSLFTNLIKSPLRYHVTSLVGFIWIPISLNQIQYLTHLQLIKVILDPIDESHHRLPTGLIFPSSLTIFKISINELCRPSIGLCQSLINHLPTAASQLIELQVNCPFGYYSFHDGNIAPFDFSPLLQLSSLRVWSFPPLNDGWTQAHQLVCANLPLTKLILPCGSRWRYCINRLDWTVFRPDALFMKSIQEWNWGDWIPTDVDWQHLTQHPPPHLRTLTMRYEASQPMPSTGLIALQLHTLTLFAYYDYDQRHQPSGYGHILSALTSLTSLTLNDPQLKDEELCEILEALTQFQLEELHILSPLSTKLDQSIKYLPRKSTIQELTLQTLQLFPLYLSQANRLRVLHIDRINVTDPNFYPPTQTVLEQFFREDCPMIQLVTIDFINEHALKLKCDGISNTHPPAPHLIGVEMNPGPDDLNPNQCSTSNVVPDDSDLVQLESNFIELINSFIARPSTSIPGTNNLSSPSRGSPTLHVASLSVSLVNNITDLTSTTNDIPANDITRPTSTTTDHLARPHHLCASTLFADGLHIIYSYLTDHEFFQILHVSRHWSHCCGTGPSRQMEYYSTLIKDSSEHITRESRLNYHFTRLELPHPPLPLDKSMVMIQLLPHLTKIDFGIQHGSTDLCSTYSTQWPNNLKSLACRFGGQDYPQLFRFICRINSLTSLRLEAVGEVCSGFEPSDSFRSLRQLSSLTIGPTAGFQFPTALNIVFPSTLTELTVWDDHRFISALHRLQNLQSVRKLHLGPVGLLPNDLRLIHSQMPNLESLEGVQLCYKDVDGIVLFQHLESIHIQFNHSGPRRYEYRSFSIPHLIDLLSQLPHLTHLQLNPWFLFPLLPAEGLIGDINDDRYWLHASRSLASLTSLHLTLPQNPMAITAQCKYLCHFAHRLKRLTLSGNEYIAATIMNVVLPLNRLEYLSVIVSTTLTYDLNELKLVFDSPEVLPRLRELHLMCRTFRPQLISVEFVWDQQKAIDIWTYRLKSPSNKQGNDITQTNDSMATPPAAELVGIEPNPGPTPTAGMTFSTGALIVQPHQRVLASTLFADGLHIVYSFLNDHEFFQVLHVSRHWSHCCGTGPSRQMEYYSTWVKDSSDHITRDSRLNYHFTRLEPSHKAPSRLFLSELIHLLRVLPYLTAMDIVIMKRSSDVSSADSVPWPRKLRSLSCSFEGRDYPQLFRSICQLSSLTSLSLDSLGSRCVGFDPSDSFRPLTQLTTLQIRQCEPDPDPLQFLTAPSIFFPPAVTNLTIYSHHFLDALTRTHHYLRQVRKLHLIYLGLKPNGLRIIHSHMPDLEVLDGVQFDHYPNDISIFTRLESLSIQFPEYNFSTAFILPFIVALGELSQLTHLQLMPNSFPTQKDWLDAHRSLVHLTSLQIDVFTPHSSPFAHLGLFADRLKRLTIISGLITVGDLSIIGALNLLEYLSLSSHLTTSPNWTPEIQVNDWKWFFRSTETLPHLQALHLRCTSSSFIWDKSKSINIWTYRLESHSSNQINDTTVTPPAQPLVGIETNPGPTDRPITSITTSTTSALTVQPQQRALASTLFADGLHIIYSYLIDREFFQVLHVSRHWSHCCGTGPSRQMEYYSIWSKVRGRWLHITPDSRLNYHFTRFEFPYQIVSPLYLSDRIDIIRLLPHLTKIDLWILNGSTDLSVTNPMQWPHKLRSLICRFERSDYPTLFRSICQLSSLTSLLLGSVGLKCVGFIPSESFRPLTQLTSLKMLQTNRVIDPFQFRTAASIFFPTTLTDLTVCSDHFVRALPRTQNLKQLRRLNLTFLSLQPNDLGIIHAHMPELESLNGAQFCSNDFKDILLFNRLQSISPRFAHGQIIPSTDSIIHVLSQLPDLTQLQLNLDLFPTERDWSQAHQSLTQMTSLEILSFIKRLTVPLDYTSIFADRLKRFTLGYPDITQADLNIISSFHQLEELSLISAVQSELDVALQDLKRFFDSRLILPRLIRLELRCKEVGMGPESVEFIWDQQKPINVWTYRTANSTMISNKPPAPRLVVETNPGPIHPTTTAVVQMTSQIMFNAGLHLIYSYLYLDEWLECQSTCHYWYEAGRSPHNRDLSYTVRPGAVVTYLPPSHLLSQFTRMVLVSDNLDRVEASALKRLKHFEFRKNHPLHIKTASQFLPPRYSNLTRLMFESLKAMREQFYQATHLEEFVLEELEINDADERCSLRLDPSALLDHLCSNITHPLTQIQIDCINGERVKFLYVKSSQQVQPPAKRLVGVELNPGPVDASPDSTTPISTIVVPVTQSAVSRLYRDVLHIILTYLDLRPFVLTSIVNKSWMLASQSMRPRHDELKYRGRVDSLTQSSLRIHINRLKIDINFRDQLEPDGLYLLRERMDHLIELNLSIRVIPYYINYLLPLKSLHSHMLPLPTHLQKLLICFDFTDVSHVVVHKLRDYLSRCMKDLATQSTHLVKLKVRLENIYVPRDMACLPELRTLSTVTDLTLPHQFDTERQLELIKTIPSIRVWHSHDGRRLNHEAIQRLIDGSNSNINHLK